VPRDLIANQSISRLLDRDGYVDGYVFGGIHVPGDLIANQSISRLLDRDGYVDGYVFGGIHVPADLIANQSISRLLDRDGYVDGYLCMWGSHVPTCLLWKHKNTYIHDMVFGNPEKAGRFMYLDERHVLEFTMTWYPDILRWPGEGPGGPCTCMSAMS
jgi:hypothetical protein